MNLVHLRMHILVSSTLISTKNVKHRVGARRVLERAYVPRAIVVSLWRRSSRRQDGDGGGLGGRRRHGRGAGDPLEGFIDAAGASLPSHMGKIWAGPGLHGDSYFPVFLFLGYNKKWLGVVVYVTSRVWLWPYHGRERICFAEYERV